MKDKAEVAEFYDEFSSIQKTLAYNERHFLMLDKLLALGLKKDSNVLELGCGIGVISSLINKVVKTGKHIAVDISPKNIEIAKENNLNKNIEFYVGDVVEFIKNDISYDFIVLFDVLEHIPIDSHNRLFANISSQMSDKTRFIINIPTPDYLEYLHKTSPETMQIIDQPLPLIGILKATEVNNLYLKYLKIYDLWEKNTSQFMIFEKKRDFILEKTAPPKQSFIRRLQNKFEYYW